MAFLITSLKARTSVESRCTLCLKKSRLKGCSTVQKIVTEIVIEIYMEQTRLFQCNRFHYADFRD